MKWIVDAHDDLDTVARAGGGKATGLLRLQQSGAQVPPWFCLSTHSFDAFVAASGVARVPPDGGTPELAAEVDAAFAATSLPPPVQEALAAALEARGWGATALAVRSSGVEEDGAEHSFAGQFATLLYQRGVESVEGAIKACWASAYSKRVLAYRTQHGLLHRPVQMGVVVQAMLDPDAAGVVFSRHPTRPLERQSIVVESVYGLGEGLMGGALEADRFEVNRTTHAFTAKLAHKASRLVRSPDGGLREEPTPPALRDGASLTDAQVVHVAAEAVRLEAAFGVPLDIEWAFAAGTLYGLQARPITSLPPEPFFASSINGHNAVLWDNSNIIESYSGVTTPLTFSFASRAYEQVYIQFCRVMGVPRGLVARRASMFRNMLGLVRGRIYYNLVNWYRLVLMLPGAGNNPAFMETMMGVRQRLKPEHAGLFDFIKKAPRYSPWNRVVLGARTLWRFLWIDRIVEEFQAHFDATYQWARKRDFERRSLPEQLAIYQYLDEQLLSRWTAPIINDFLCMVFFGLLKKLTGAWVGVAGDAGASLQNDLLCGQGDLESVEPTRLLMRIAEWIDTAGAELRAWLLATPPREVWAALQGGAHPALAARLQQFLELYGFRCVDELKLEASDLHDDPSFAISAIASYVRLGTYNTEGMAAREASIREKAHARVRAT
ncbi:MAG TPA: PEP/pyruvate-binding domain-containing protein, partial [Myxococcota bacterium]|nr:PEP/pyruvate-binding domain-containing protein [Myxococcota bacterium]